MVQRMATCFVTMVALGAGLPGAAQSDNSDEGRREREQVLEQQAREQQARQAEQQARQAGAQARQAEQQARQIEQQASRDREQVALDSAEVRRELAKAREQLAASASEIARLSAQMTAPVLRSAPSLVRLATGGRAVLGLNIQDSDLGVRVSGVTPNGPADDAGVTVGDTIVAVDGVDLGRASTEDGRSPSAVLLGQISNVEAGDEMELRILRDGDYRDVVVEAGDNSLSFVSIAGDRHPSFVSILGDDPEHIVRSGTWVTSFGRFGGPWSDIELIALTPALGEYFGVDEGLLVVRAGRAAELGFRDGDVILEIGTRQPQSPEHAMRILGSFEPGESLQASIMRQRRREALTIEVPEDAGNGWVRYVR